ncbi:hypothetical protein [Pseudomonas sp. NPDC096950]|uniref:hypothetical protein n=1 Tax=Pseudomonas sp. NPDC096950 TaxID=3364485 RepID=UPI00383AFDF4
MFYGSLKASWLEGRVRISLPPFGCDGHSTIEASGLCRLKAVFLNQSERELLVLLAKLDAVLVMQCQNRPVNTWTTEQRVAVKRSIQTHGLGDDRSPQRALIDHIGVQVFQAPRHSEGFGRGGGKGKSDPELAHFSMLLEEYRHALVKGLGASGADYKIACIPTLAGIRHAGVAVRLEDQRAYLLIDGTDQGLPEYLPALLAKDVSAFLRTRAVPDAISKSRWPGLNRGPIIAYKFRLTEFPTCLHF